MHPQTLRTLELLYAFLHTLPSARLILAVLLMLFRKSVLKHPCIGLLESG
jgi:hypothetical protein